MTVPQGLTAVSNGVLTNSRTRKGWTTWTWDMKEPMASYLATATVGQFDLHAYRSGGIRYWDAVDPDLYAPVASPRTGSRFALSQVGDSAYKRLAHTIHVPDTGAQLSFWVTRDTEFAWDFAFVEAHTVGTDDWTTLPDRNGHTSDERGTLPVLARAAPLPDPLPERQRGWNVLAQRHDRNLVRRHRGQ